MGVHCSDVNTIFAFTDINHRFYQIVYNHFRLIKSEKYILLNHVKTTFVSTYSDNLKRVGDIIISAVNKVKKGLIERKIRYPPTDVLKNILIKTEITKLIKEMKDKELNPTDYDYYKNILLKDFPLIELLNNKEKLAQFDSEYVKRADSIVKNKIDEFLSFFSSTEISPKLDQKKIKELMSELKKIKNQYENIFKSHDDEDIRLSSEYLSYCIQRKVRLNISSTDKNLTDSLKFVEKEKGINCGEIRFLLVS